MTASCDAGHELDVALQAMVVGPGPGCGVLDVVSAVYGVSIRDVEYPWY